MGYSAGTLDLSILGASDSAVKSIENVVKSLNSLSRSIQIIQKTDITKMFDKLAESVSIFSQNASKLDVSGFEKLAVIGSTGKGINSLANGINKLNSAQTVFATQQLSNLFEKLSVSTKNLDSTTLQSLSSIGKSLNSISNISKLDKIDWDKAGQGFNKLATAITPFLNKVKEAEASLTALYGILNKSSGKKIGNLLNGSDSESPSKSKGFSSFLNVGKWTAVIYSAKRLGSYMAKVVQYGADYTETLNLWETAMGGNLTVATEFVNKMNEAYGISEKTLMNAQAIFKNMLGSLGQISDTMAYALSEGVTQMALDYASLYNVTFEQAFTKFQAALAGQVRPIRSVAGYDITENTLFQLYQSLGGEKTMRQLSRTEKQLLAIYAVFKQMDASGAVGDLDKTMESFANQSRVMAEGWQRTMTYAGVIATHLIEQSGLMVQLNAFLIFMADTLKAVAENMGAIKSFADPFESTTEGALDAGEAIDEVKGKLLGFDKFRSLSGEGNNVLGLDEKLLEALAGFDSILGNADMEAQKLAEKFKILSGLFDKDGVFNPDRWNEITTSIKQIGGALLAVAGIIVGAKFGQAIIGAFDYITLSILEVMTTTKGLTSNVTLLGKAFSFIITHPIISTLVAVGAYLFYLYNTNEEFRVSVNNLFGSLKPLFTLLGDLINQILTPLGNLLGETFGLVDKLFIFIVKQAIPVLQTVVVTIIPVAYALEFVVKVLESLMEILTALFRFNFEGLGSKLKSIWGGKWSSFDFANSAIGQFSMNDYANGGLPDKGTIFRAGEAGAEMVYNMPNGQSGVANVRQIEQAMYNALARYGEQNGGAIVVQAYLDGEKVYENTTARAKSQGFVWAKA